MRTSRRLCHPAASSTKVHHPREALDLNLCLVLLTVQRIQVKGVNIRRTSIWLEREFCVVIEQQQQLILFTLATQLLEIQLVAELPLKEGGFERRADGEGEVLMRV